MHAHPFPPLRPAPPAWSARRVRPGMAMLSLAWLACVLTVTAFPPAPHHTLYGMVRNEWGDPIDVSGAQVFIESTNGVGVSAFIAASTDPGVNYTMRLPMDSGASLDLYQGSAMRPSQGFLLKVQIGNTVYLPIEMILASPQVGQPAGATRLDLTLGEDSDGDGLPDAWEQAIIALLGGTLADITPEGDADGDGLSNRDEYVAGTFAFDPNDGFTLSLQRIAGRSSYLEFMVLRGRTYSVQASDNLEEWFPVSFHHVIGDASGPPMTEYRSDEVSILQVEVVAPPGAGHRYYKAVVQ